MISDKALAEQNAALERAVARLQQMIEDARKPLDLGAIAGVQRWEDR